MISGYYFVTDSGLSRRGIGADVTSAIAAGTAVIQYRRKDVSTKMMYEEALMLRRLCKKATFIVNDRVDIALAVGADGVHLGQSDLNYRVARGLLGKNKIIGVTAHSLKEALLAAACGADYLGVSPIFATNTKRDAGKPSGVSLLSAIKEHVDAPLVAIGGITLDNAAAAIAAGADALCAISAVVTKQDVKAEIKKFQKLFKRFPGRSRNL